MLMNNATDEMVTLIIHNGSDVVILILNTAADVRNVFLFFLCSMYSRKKLFLPKPKIENVFFVFLFFHVSRSQRSLKVNSKLHEKTSPR